MLCRNPYTGGAVPVGCGQCLPCRINRRRLWMWRQFLESLCHDECCFVTLTYSEDTVPFGGTLRSAHLRDFIKRLRSNVSSLGQSTGIRFFGVGEYGDETGRPHYHLSLFGVGYAHAAIIQKCWLYGYSLTAEFNETTAQYVAGYVTKKLTMADDPRLGDRSPEFARMSNRPGLGAPAMAVIAESLHCDAGLDELIKSGDVPFQLKLGKKSIPLGRYLREKLRDEMGVPQAWRDRARQRFTWEKSFELSAMLQDQLTDTKVPLTVKKVIVNLNLGAMANVEARSKLIRKKPL